MVLGGPDNLANIPRPAHQKYCTICLKLIRVFLLRCCPHARGEETVQQLCKVLVHAENGAWLSLTVGLLGTTSYTKEPSNSPWAPLTRTSSTLLGPDSLEAE